MSSVPCSKSICLPKTSPCVSRRDYTKNSPRRSRRECFGGSSRRTGTPERKPYTIYTLYFSGECRIREGRASAIGSKTANARAQRASPLCSRSNPVTLAHTISILRAPDAALTLMLGNRHVLNNDEVDSATGPLSGTPSFCPERTVGEAVADWAGLIRRADCSPTHRQSPCRYQLLRDGWQTSQTWISGGADG